MHHGEKGQGTAAHNYSQLEPQWGREGHQQVSTNGMTDCDSVTLARSVKRAQPDRREGHSLAPTPRL